MCSEVILAELDAVFHTPDAIFKNGHYMKFDTMHQILICKHPSKCNKELNVSFKEKYSKNVTGMLKSNKIYLKIPAHTYNGMWRQENQESRSSSATGNSEARLSYIIFHLKTHTHISGKNVKRIFKIYEIIHISAKNHALKMMNKRINVLPPC